MNHIEEMYSRFEKILKAKNILLIFLFLAFGIWTMPWPISMPGSGLDPSWVIGINKAVSDNLQFGPEIAFTFGPLGFLYYHSYIDPTLWFLQLIFNLFIHFLFFLSLALLMVKSSANWKEYIVVLVLVIIPITFIRDYELLLSVGIFLYLITSSKLDRKYEVYVLSFVSLLLAIASLIKSNIAIISLSIILTFLLVCIFKKEFQKHLYVFILYFILVPILWLITGQHLANLQVYLSNSLQLSSGYNDAMAIQGPEWQIYLGLIGVIFILFLLVYSLVKRKQELVFFILLNNILLFIAFKHGFVRQDGHEKFFFGTYAIFFMYIYIILGKSKTNFAVRSISLILSILFVVSIYNGFPNAMQENILQKLPAYEKSFSLISNQTYQNQVVLGAKYNIKLSYPLDNNSIHYLNNKTLDIFPWDIALVWAYDFTWSPRPVFQSYSAYTRQLDTLNAQHFSNIQAPKAILYSFKSIDGRYPIFDEPSTFANILNNYTFIKKSGEFLLLSYNPKKNNTIIEKDLGTVNVEPGQPIKIPVYDSGYVFGRIELEYSMYGKFMKLIYKPALAHIRFTFSDNTKSNKFRFIPGVSMNGVFLSQYVNKVNDLASIFSGYITQDITELTIDVDNPAYYTKNVKVMFVGVPANITIQNNSDSSIPDWRLLKQLQGGIMQIDTLGNNQYAQAKIWAVDKKRDQFIRISGWAIDDRTKDGEVKKFLVLNGGNDPIVLPTKKKFRPDVADYFGIENYKLSGWEATIRSKGFKDCFNISVRILRSNGEEYYELDGDKPICFI